MKRIIFISLLMLVVLGLSAQRNVRKETHKGDTNYREQKYGAAEEKYKSAIELYANSKNNEIKEEDKSKEAFYNLGNTYYRQGRWDEAIKEYSNYQTMESNPSKQSGAWSNIGNSYLNKAIRKTQPKDMSQQQGNQQQGVQQQPEQPEKLPRLEDLNKSMDAYKNALRLNPTDEEARYNLATVQKMIKDQKDNNQNNQNNQNQKQQKDEQQKQDEQQKKDEKQKQDEQQKQQQQNNQMSQQNIEQILNAIEQDEKETQARVQQQKADERKKMNAQNRKQNKDW